MGDEEAKDKIFEPNTSFSDYKEIQIHGSVQLDRDIESLHVPDDTDPILLTEMTSFCETNGITLVPFRTGEMGREMGERTGFHFPTLGGRMRGGMDGMGRMEGIDLGGRIHHPRRMPTCSCCGDDCCRHYTNSNHFERCDFDRCNVNISSPHRGNINGLKFEP